MTTYHTIVIGAGIAGLAAAWRLAAHGRDVLVLEHTSRAGGLIRTERTADGLLCECGPNAFLGGAEALAQLASETGIADQVIAADPSAALRFIFHRGALHPVPRGPAALITSRLLSWRGKLRLCGEVFVRSRGAPNETVAQFVRRRLGPEALERLIDPLVAGIFAGDPEQLALAAAFPKMVRLEAEHGGLIRGAIRLRGGFAARGGRSFLGGMETLPRAIAERLGDRVRHGIAVTALGREDDGAWRIDGHGQRFRARRVILATPAPVAAALLGPILPAAADLLLRIPYAPIVVVHAAYRRGDAPRAAQGFGFLVPRAAPVRMLGTLWPSNCFPGRAPDDICLMTAFFGGMRDPAIQACDDATLARIFAQDVAATMGVTAAPLQLHITRHAAAIPQYTVGHRDRIAALAQALANSPGLQLTGNYFTGTSVNETIAHAIAIAKTACSE